MHKQNSDGNEGKLGSSAEQGREYWPRRSSTRVHYSPHTHADPKTTKLISSFLSFSSEYDVTVLCQDQIPLIPALCAVHGNKHMTKLLC